MPHSVLPTIALTRTTGCVMRNNKVIRKVQFSVVLPLWELLWPHRKSKIEPISYINPNGEIDMSIGQYLATFWGILSKENKLIGVVSAHQTEKRVFRLRGLYVIDSFRGQGLASKLINHVCEYTKKKGAMEIWTLPRKTSWPVYQKIGFKLYTDWINDKYEFGPNAFAKKNLFANEK